MTLFSRIESWFSRRALPKTHLDDALVHDFVVCFSTPSGQRVLQHLLDTIYCEIYEGSDAILLATHNGRRSVVHEILFNIDVGEHPERYQAPIVETADA